MHVVLYLVSRGVECTQMVWFLHVTGSQHHLLILQLSSFQKSLQVHVKVQQGLVSISLADCSIWEYCCNKINTIQDYIHMYVPSAFVCTYMQMHMNMYIHILTFRCQHVQ